MSGASKPLGLNGDEIQVGDIVEVHDDKGRRVIRGRVNMLSQGKNGKWMGAVCRVNESEGFSHPVASFVPVEPTESEARKWAIIDLYEQCFDLSDQEFVREFERIVREHYALQGEE